MRLLFFTLFYELSEKLHLVINLRNNAACPNTVIHYCSSHVGNIVSWKHLKSESIINILHSLLILATGCLLVLFSGSEISTLNVTEIKVIFSSFAKDTY